MMKRGFTLIELLVVIAIIAILAAILFPVFARAREKARQSSCLSNQKQIALGWHMYVQDYDERIPAYSRLVGGAWILRVHEVIEPYIKSTQIWACPSDDHNNSNYIGYGYNCYYLGDWRSSPPSAWVLADVTYPAECFIFGEGKGWPYIEPPGVEDDRMRFEPHNGGANYSFCDGHAKWMAKSTVYCKVWPSVPDWYLSMR